MDLSEKSTRKTARLRASLVPGTGFAFLGYPLPAYLSLAFGTAALAALVVACFAPSTLMLWLALILLLGVIVFWAAEYMAVGRITIHPSGESGIVSRHFIAACVLTYTVALAAAGCLLFNFGSYQIRGDGMVPVVYPGDLLLYHKQVVAADLVPGNRFTFVVPPESSWGRPGDIVLARILAGPGDKIAIAKDHYLVNGKDSGVEASPVGPLPVRVDVPESPAQITVPPDCYYCVQEQPSAFDSRTLSWARRQDVLATKLWLISRRALLQPLTK
jgi:signal peptidase I